MRRVVFAPDEIPGGDAPETRQAGAATATGANPSAECGGNPNVRLNPEKIEAFGTTAACSGCTRQQEFVMPAPCIGQFCAVSVQHAGRPFEPATSRQAAAGSTDQVTAAARRKIAPVLPGYFIDDFSCFDYRIKS